MLKRGLASVGLVMVGVALAATPVTVGVGAGDGVTVAASYAWAKHGRDDRGGDDRGGRGRGRDDRGGDDRGGRRDDDRPRPTGGGKVTVVKVEQSRREIEVVYSDGTKEEIEGSRYERKNRAGDTVVERRATARDRARLQAIAAR